MGAISSSQQPANYSRCAFHPRRLYLSRVSLMMPRANSSGLKRVKAPRLRNSLALAKTSSQKKAMRVGLMASSLKRTPAVRQKSRKVTKVACWTSKFMASKMVRSACSQSCWLKDFSAQRWYRLRQGTFLSSSTAFPATISAALAQNFSQGCSLCRVWKICSPSARVQGVKRNLSQMEVRRMKVSSAISTGSACLEAALRRELRQWRRLKWKGLAYLVVLTASLLQLQTPQRRHFRSRVKRCWQLLTYLSYDILVLKLQNQSCPCYYRIGRI